MSVTESKHESSEESDEDPDEDPKLMLLVEAGLVPGLDDNLNHLKRRFKKKKKKKKNKRKRMESEILPRKKTKLDLGSMDYCISKIISHLNKPSKFEAYQNCLMMSEWLVKVPEDLKENWIMVPCPPGKRMLVVCASGSTRSFAKSGDFMFFFQSAMPGGHLVERDESSKSLTVLDCIWHHRNKTYYVLDVLSWNNSHLLYCEASFRFFFLEQKLLELGSRLNESETNHYRFSYLPRVQCNKEELIPAMTNSYVQDEFNGIIDGYLFYEQSAHYLSGESSAAGWIKPFMVPEVFNTTETPELLADRPEDYESMDQYINEFENDRKKIIKKERKIRQKRLGYSSDRRQVKKDVQSDLETNVNISNDVALKHGNGDVIVNVDMEENISGKEDTSVAMQSEEMKEKANFMHSNNEMSVEVD